MISERVTAIFDSAGKKSSALLSNVVAVEDEHMPPAKTDMPAVIVREALVGVRIRHCGTQEMRQAIRDAFVAEHGLATIHGALHRSNLNDMDTLPTALYDAFVQLHAEMTEGRMILCHASD
eukprot:COSAG02_NODE_7489_length_2989_cov_6.657383_4_plen_121_part_00